MIARIETALPLPADQVWTLLVKRDTFFYITRGALAFSNSDTWPEQFEAGQTITTHLILFGLIPAWRHTLTLVRVDERTRRLVSQEHGGFIRRWDHAITVVPAGDGSRYRDEITIDAGLLTPLIWLYAHIFYRYRQMRWHKLARQHLSYRHV